MKKRSAYKRGLTLIEVLIAMVVLSLGVSSMMIAMSRCLAVVRTARHRENARNLLRQVDIENPLIAEELEEGRDDGSFDDYEEYTWEREVAEVNSEERPGLFLITTRIRWSEKGQHTFEEVVAYKYAPEAESVKSRVQSE